jgi:hypothetical protein
LRLPAALALAAALCGAPCVARTQDVTRTGALVSVSVVPATVTVGQPFSVRIRVRAPKFAVVHFPAVPDTADAIEAVDPRAMEDAGDVELIDRTAVYRLVAWDVGKRTPHFANVTVTTAGTDQVYPVAIPPVNVTSLLPADSAQRIPKEARDLVEPPSALWKWLLLGAVFAWLIWLLWRRHKRRAAEAPKEPEPSVAAAASFDALDALALPAAGEPGRHVIASIDILRAYLARRFPDMRDSLTAEEVARALPASDLPVLPERLSNILDRETSLRFAHAAVSTDEALALGTEARAIVRDIQSAHEARVRAMERGPQRGRRR